MATIMCAQKLHDAILKGAASSSLKPLSTPAGAGRLGNWAATLVAEDGRLVVAQNERTCLTLIFELTAPATFRTAFADRLRQVLRGCGVPARAIGEECDVLRGATIVRLRNAALMTSLDFAAFEAAAHNGGGRTAADLQDKLNTSGIECVPRDEVRKLFGVQRAVEKMVTTGRRG